MSFSFTPAEEAALLKFREKIADVLPTLSDYEAHDANLVRWIRARELNLSKAEDMFRKALKWREEMQVHKYEGQPFPNLMLENFPIAPGGVDRQGAIVSIIPFGLWDLRGWLEKGHADDLEKYIIQLLDRCIYHLIQKSDNMKTMQTQYIFIFDFNQYSIRQVLSTVTISAVSKILQIFEANHPERLKAAYVINAPKVFEIFWPLIKPFLHKHTLAKVQIFAGNAERWKKALLANMDSRELPSIYGGARTCFRWYKNSDGFGWAEPALIFPDGEFETKEIAAGEKFIKTFPLEKGKIISWNFKTEGYDIGFEFTNDAGQPIFLPGKVDAHLHVQAGQYVVEEKGKYSLVFDNSHSKLRPKVLHYQIRLQESVNSE